MAKKVKRKWRPSKYEYWHTLTKHGVRWFWRLRASNGEPVSGPVEGLSSKQSCLRSIEAARVASWGAGDPVEVEG